MTTIERVYDNDDDKVRENKIIVWMQSSLDGFTAGPNGEFDWPVIGDEIHTHFVTTLRDAGLFVYGRTVFEMMAGYWPVADTLPDATANTVAYSQIWRPMPKVVVSRTLTGAEWNATVVADPTGVRELADAADGDSFVFGGSRTVAALAQADLVDEYQIFVHPVVLGGGTPLFPPLTDRQAMTLLESRTFDGRVAGLRFARARER
jgi:dihydrofolate reductase